MHKYLLLILTVCSLNAAAQTATDTLPSDTVKWTPITRIIIEPSYKGNLKRTIEALLQYPEKAVKKRIEGIVIIAFTVDEKGRVINVHAAAESPQKNKLLVREAIRIIKLTDSKWRPGIDNGDPVKSTLTQSFYFAL